MSAVQVFEVGVKVGDVVTLTRVGAARPVTCLITKVADPRPGTVGKRFWGYVGVKSTSSPTALVSTWVTRQGYPEFIAHQSLGRITRIAEHADQDTIIHP